MSADVTSQTLTNFHISTFEYEEAPIQMARDLVKGIQKDYFFFQYDDDEFVLLMGDNMVSENGHDCSSSDCDAVVFWKVPNQYSTVETDSISLSGESATVGATPNVEQITLTGTITDQYTTYHWQTYIVPNVSLHVYNTEHLVYGSDGEYMPKLIEGVDYYAYAWIFIALSVIVFRLLDRIFGRVCRIH